MGLCLGKVSAVQFTAHSFLLEASHLHFKCLHFICVIITALPLQRPFVFLCVRVCVCPCPRYSLFLSFLDSLSSKPVFSFLIALSNVSLLLQHNCLFPPSVSLN